MFFQNIFQTDEYDGIRDQLECVSQLVGDAMKNMLTRMVERE